MEIDGIKDISKLIKLILEKLEDPNPEISCYVFLGQIRHNNMTELMKSPLMLIFAVDVWNGNNVLPKSKCIYYIKMIESLISRAETNRESVSDECTSNRVMKLQGKWSDSANLLPGVFPRHGIEYIPTHAGLLLSLGHLASDLLLGQKEQSLVFPKDVCKDYNINEGDGSLKVCLHLVY